MERKHFDFSAFAIALIIIAILLSACSIGKNVDPNGGTTKPNESISTTEPTTVGNVNNSENGEENEYIYNYDQCSVAPYDKESIELLGTQNFTPGYLLFKEDWEGEYRVLLAKKLKEPRVAEFKNSVYAITEDNEIIEVSKTDGAYKTVYTSKHGSIDYISSVNCFNRYVYFNDGNYIIELDPTTNECAEKLKCDKEISAIYPGGDVVKINDISIYCDNCGEGTDYFVYIVGSEDEGYESYWHHPETGKDELLESLDQLHTYGEFVDDYKNLFVWKVEK